VTGEVELQGDGDGREEDDERHGLCEIQQRDKILKGATRGWARSSCLSTFLKQLLNRSRCYGKEMCTAEFLFSLAGGLL
jgi:hypothetical protein